MTLTYDEAMDVIESYFGNKMQSDEFIFGLHDGDTIIAKDPTNDDAPFLIFSDGDDGLVAFHHDMGGYRMETISLYASVHPGNMLLIADELELCSELYEDFLDSLPQE